MAERVAAVCVLAAGLAAAADPSPLDRLDPAKVPPALRPKDLPKEVVAVLGKRGDRSDCLAFRPDGRLLAIAGPDQNLHVWDLDALRLVGTTRLKDAAVCLAFTPDGKTLAVGEGNGGVRLFEGLENRVPFPRAAFPAHKDGPVWAVAASPDGKTLATAGGDGVVKLWSLSSPTPTPAAALTGHTAAVRGLAFAPDGKTLFSAGGDENKLRAWDVGAAKAAGAVELPAAVTSVAVTPDGSALITGGAKGASRVWALKGGLPGEPVGLAAGGKGVASVAAAGDGGHVAGVLLWSKTEDRVAVWGRDGAKVREVAPDLHVKAVAFAPDGRHLAAVTEVGTLVVRLPR